MIKIISLELRIKLSYLIIETHYDAIKSETGIILPAIIGFRYTEIICHIQMGGIQIS